jgi:tetratricopeptide (TPR) repeat protein
MESMSRKQNQQTRDSILREFYDQKQTFNFTTIPGMVKTVWTTNDNVKPSDGKIFNLDQLSLVSVDELKLDTIHRGKYLSGKLIVDPNLAASVQTLLEDEFGSIVRVSIYNAIPANVPQRNHLVYCHQHFPKGHYLTIKQPFFKIRMDGTPGIRIETLDDVIVSALPKHAVKSAEEWKKEGNTSYQNKDFTSALKYYRKGLSVLNTGNILTKLLTNLSLCSSKAQDHFRALLFALTANACDETSDKACYRIALSLEALKYPREANAFLKLMSAAASSDSNAAIRRLVTTYGAAALQPMSQVELAKKVSSLLLKDSWSSLCTPATVSNVDEHSASIAEPLKLEGDALFREGNHTEASIKYLRALTCFTNQSVECSPVILLSNITQCHLNLDSVPLATMTSLAAICLDHTHIKSHQRLCESLIRLELFDCALCGCNQAMQLFPNEEKQFSSLRSRILSAEKLSDANELAQVKNKATAEKMKQIGVRTEKSKYQEEKAVNAAYEVTAMQNFLFSQPEIAKKTKKKFADEFGVDGFVDDRVVPFHLEFLKEVGLPPECDANRCRERLYHAYEIARGIRVHEISLIMPKIIDDLRRKRNPRNKAALQ